MVPFSGKQLKEMREEAGFTQKELAQRLQISRETISGIERELPSTIYSLDLVIAQKWFRTCKSGLSKTRIQAFMSYIESYFFS